VPEEGHGYKGGEADEAGCCVEEEPGEVRWGPAGGFFE